MAEIKESESNVYILSTKSARKIEESFPDPNPNNPPLKYPVYTFRIPDKVFKSGAPSLSLKVSLLGFHFGADAGAFGSRDMFLCIKGASSNIMTTSNIDATFWLAIDFPLQTAIVVEHKGFLTIAVRKTNVRSTYHYLAAPMSLLLEIVETKDPPLPKNIFCFVNGKEAIQTSTDYSVTIPTEKFEQPRNKKLKISLFDAVGFGEPTLCCIKGAEDTVHFSGKRGGTFLIGSSTMSLGSRDGMRWLSAMSLPRTIQKSELKFEKTLTFRLKEISEGKDLRDYSDFTIIFELGEREIGTANLLECQIKDVERHVDLADEKKVITPSALDGAEAGAILAVLKGMELKEEARHKALVELIRETRREGET